MASGEDTGAKNRTEIVSIKVEPGSSSSHSTRNNQQESASPKRENLKIWLKNYGMVTFIELVVCILFLGGLIASLISPGYKNHEIWGLELWKWCVLVLVIVGGRRIVKWTIRKFEVNVIKKIFFFMECKVYYSYYIYTLGKYVRVFLWFGLALLICYLLFKSSKVKRSKLDSNVQKFIMRSLAACVIGGFLWVLKNLLVNILTPPILQAKRLFDRIRESLIDQYILEVFSPKGSAAKLTKLVDINWIKQNNLPAHGCITGGKMKVINWLKKIEREEICAWAMKELIDLIRFTQLSSITEQLETLAKKEKDVTNIFKKIEDVATRNFGRMEIEEFGLRWFFNEEAGDVVQHINGADEEDKMLERQPLRKWLANAIIERRSLAKSLEESKRLRKELNKIVSGTVLILVFIIWLILLKFLTTATLVLIITQFAALAFIFGDTLKSVFQGIIFVSVMHPFDIGDCCLIKGEEMVVERINLLSTVFRKNMKDKIVYQNSVLTTSHVKNLHKGNRHVIEDSFEITIASSTPKARIKALKSKIERFLEDVNKEQWLKKHDFNFKEIKNQRLKIVLSVLYRKTDLLSDWEIINNRRHIVVKKLKESLEDENEMNGQKNEEDQKGMNKHDGQEKEEKGKNKVGDGQTKEEKDKNQDDGRKTGKMKIKYYNILPKVVDAE